MVIGTTSRPQSLVLPDDDHNRTLVENAHPPDWINPNPSGRYNLLVIGAGTAGLVSAIGAALMGARVAIVERHLTGGDCLNFGCVPSKALISAARAAHVARTGAAFGVRTADPQVDFPAVMARMRRLRAELAPNDSAARLTQRGVDVYIGEARFTSADSVQVADRVLTFRRAIVASGARAAVPDIPGLAEAGFLTNETVFSLTERPRHLVVVGAGPIGCELAQAFRRFGSDVTIIGRDGKLLPKEDADAKELIARAFDREGITVHTATRIVRIERRSGPLPRVVIGEHDGRTIEVAGDTILVAVGRAPNTEGLSLDRARIAFDRGGVTVDDRLRTTNARVFAAGDVCSRYKFTHAADAMARVALRNALFFGRKKASALVVPWATYTDPEVAHVGMNASEAARRGDAIVTLTHQLADNDRAVLDGASEGFARVHLDRRTGKILGATLVASHAGEMIAEIALAMQAGVSMTTLGFTIHPYPTQSEAWKRLGDRWNERKLSPGLRRVCAALFRWQR